MRGYPRLVSSRKPRLQGMIHLPAELRPYQHNRYPPDNMHSFERWFMDLFVSNNAQERIYLPIQWTALYCNNKYGKCSRTIGAIQRFIDALDKSQKYYTIVQYDDGILNDLSGLDIKVFGMSGGTYDYPIPLICMPHRQFVEHARYTATFVGSMTHPIRQNMFDQLKDKNGYLLTNESMHIDEYTKVMTKGVFALAPRGYGPTSFRIGEAVLAGSIPVYISDVHILPYGQPFDYGLIVHPEEDIYSRIEAVTGNEQLELQKRARSMRPIFQYEGCKILILEQVKNIPDERTPENTDVQ